MKGLQQVVIACCIAAVLCQDFEDSDGAGDFEIAEAPSYKVFAYHDVHRRSLDDELKRDDHAQRVRRSGHGVVGPVYTYVKTDHHGNFKWGAKHYVGKKYAGHHGH